MRRTVITEDIVRNALNESLEEFMLEEGWKEGFNKWWNKPYMQKIKNGFNKAGKWLNNAASIYMDEKTNGQWNQKYNTYVNGNSKYVEMYYLNKWFNWHLKQIQYIAHSGPNRGASDEIMWNKDGTGIQRRNNYNNVAQYAQRNITPDNFNGWAGRYIENRRGLKCIDEYIQDSAKHINNIDSAEQYLNIWNFLNNPKGQEYQKLSGENLENERQAHQQGVKAKQNAQTQEYIDNYKNQIKEVNKQIKEWQKFIKSRDAQTNWRNEVVGIINGTNGLPAEIKQWMDNIINSNISKDPDKVGRYITYNNFVKSNYGSKYRKMAEWVQQQTQQGQQQAQQP